MDTQHSDTHILIFNTCI